MKRRAFIAGAATLAMAPAPPAGFYICNPHRLGNYSNALPVGPGFTHEALTRAIERLRNPPPLWWFR